MRRYWPLLIFVIIFALSAWQLVSHKEEQNMVPKTTFNRIITLAPSLTEIAFAIGLDEQVIAVTDYCEYPSKVKSLPKVGGYIDTSLEAIVSHAPDLVILLKNQSQLIQQLNTLGIETLAVDNSRLTGVLNSIITIGEKTNRQAQAHKLHQQLTEQIQTIQAAVAEQHKPRVLVSIAHYSQSEQIETIYVAGQKDFYNDLLKLAGGENVYQNDLIAVPALSQEGIIKLNPDIIIDIFPEQDDHQHDLSVIKNNWQKLSMINAVKNDRVYLIEADYASVPGPRILKLLPQFAALFHPDVIRQSLDD